jgi:hypothetical protein
MTLAKRIADKARASGAVAEKNQFFTVTDKKKVDAGNGVMVDVEVPNGQHRVKILSQKIGKGKNYNGVEVDMLIMQILDNGAPKTWDMPLKNEDGTLYYMIEKLEDVEIGDEIIVEAYKMKNGRFGKTVAKVAGPVQTGDELPVVHLDEQATETDRPGLDGDEDISPEDISF